MTKTTELNPVSVLARLRHLGQTAYPNLPANSMLLLYAQQGLLARLDLSDYRERFVLKGALSLFARYRETARPTEDLDLAAAGVPNTPEEVGRMMTELCALPFGDGLSFDAASLRVRPINEGLTYPGVAVGLRATLGRSRVDLQIDVSFGNVITPGPVQWTFPALLLDQAVAIRIYPLETVLAEKFAALVELGEANTRMKDVYDLWQILGREALDAGLLAQAMTGSFAARATPLEAIAPTLGATFAHSPIFEQRWQTYLKRTGLRAPPFAEVMTLISAFYGPVLLEHRRSGTWEPGAQTWTNEAVR
jgi:Nucleotidyl transferase AbiEii toxin, Type IV TA system